MGELAIAEKPARVLKGIERAAVLLLALGEEHGRDIWKSLHEDEVHALSVAMSKLGPINTEMVEELFVDFVGRMSSAGSLTGGFDNTERLLAQFLPADRVAGIMEEIRGPAGRNMWEKLSHVPENVLANYLKNEYPQTVAVVLSKIKAEHAARVLSILPDESSREIVARMLTMETVQKEVLERLEQTLRTELMANLSQTRQRDQHELMADIFNYFDRQTEARFMSSLEEDNRDASERIKQLMFTFDDLIKLDNASVQTLLRGVDNDVLAVALKGASETARDFFFSNMSGRAASILRDDMSVMGPVRLKDVDDAQGRLVATAKDLAAKGEIMIAKNRGDEELVY